MYEQSYLNGKRHGLKRGWHENGVLKIQGNYELDIKIGTWKEFNYQGKIIKIEMFEIGRLLYEWDSKSTISFGNFKDKYENGQLKRHSYVVYDGFKINYKEWYENGKLKCEKFYKMGMKIGLWKEWNNQGKLFKSEIYDNGKLLKTLTPNESGEMVEVE